MRNIAIQRKFKEFVVTVDLLVNYLIYHIPMIIFR